MSVEKVADKHDEYPRPICLDYPFDSSKNEANYNLMMTEEYKDSWTTVSPNLLVHPFDLELLKNACTHFNVSKVVELGCGSTSRFLDRICKVERVTFANIDMTGGEFSTFKFINCDIFESYDLILEHCKTSQLFLIDAIHTAGMAEFYHPILKETKIPVFIHDWYLPNEETWPEQNYWIEQILDMYEPFVVGRGIEYCPVKSYVDGGIPPCSAVLVAK
jgi:hypothetical protein